MSTDPITLPANKRIFIARHGEREDFVNKYWWSSATRPHDPPLSKRGLHQARCLGERLKSEKVTHIFCSPYVRCLQTITPLAQSLNVKIRVEHGLGEWFGESNERLAEHFPLSTEELQKQFPLVDLEYKSFYTLREGFETEFELQQRLAETTHHLVENFVNRADTGVVVLVGHAATTITSARGILALNNAPVSAGFYQTPAGRPFLNSGVCSIVQLDRAHPHNKWDVVLKGDVSHLRVDTDAHGNGRYYNWNFSSDYDGRKDVEWYQ